MDQRLALQLDCNPTARLKWGVLASDGHFVAGPEGFGVHRAGAGHGPGLDARTAAAGLDRAPARSLQNVGCGRVSARASRGMIRNYNASCAGIYTCT